MSDMPFARGWSATAGFGRWWGGELRGLLPDGARLPSLLGARTADIRPGRAALEVVRTAAGEAERLVEAKPLSAFDRDNWDELASLLDGCRTRVILAPPLVHVLTLRLPKAARSHLRSAIPLQLRDHAPLRPELLAWGIVDVTAQDERIVVRVVIVRISTLDDIAAGFLDRDMAAAPILADVGDGQLVRLRGGRSPAGARAPSRPWWIAAGLLVSTPLWMLGALQIAVLDQQSKVAAAEQLAQPRLAAEKRLRDRAALGHALKLVLARPSVTQTIDGLAAALPLGAHATELSVSDTGQLTVTIRTGDADAAARALARDPGLTALTPTGQVAAADGATQLGFTAAIR